MFFSDALQKVILIGLGSALGGNARYWLQECIQQRWGADLPVATFIVNITGTFILGLFISIMVEKAQPHEIRQFRLFFATGFLGSYTTFSTWQNETFSLTENGSFLLAAANAFGSLFVGFVAISLGMIVGRII